MSMYEFVDKHIPYSFVEGFNHDTKTSGPNGEQDEEYSVLDMKVNANGKEALLEYFQDKARQLVRRHILQNEALFNNDLPRAFISKKNDRGGIYFTITLKNEQAAKAIDLLAFEQSVKSILETDNTVLNDFIAHADSALKRELKVLYKESLAFIDNKGA
jgi:hypothetical protein